MRKARVSLLSTAPPGTLLSSLPLHNGSGKEVVDREGREEGKGGRPFSEDALSPADRASYAVFLRSPEGAPLKAELEKTKDVFRRLREDMEAQGGAVTRLARAIEAESKENEDIGAELVGERKVMRELADQLDVLYEANPHDPDIAGVEDRIMLVRRGLDELEAEYAASNDDLAKAKREYKLARAAWDVGKAKKGQLADDIRSLRASLHAAWSAWSASNAAAGVPSPLPPGTVRLAGPNGGPLPDGSHHIAPSHSRAQLVQLFDTHKTGRIAKDELISLLHTIGVRTAGDQELDDLIDPIVSSQRNDLSVSDFVALILPC